MLTACFSILTLICSTKTREPKRIELAAAGGAAARGTPRPAAPRHRGTCPCWTAGRLELDGGMGVLSAGALCRQVEFI
jgi:hypothetical protein